MSPVLWEWLGSGWLWSGLSGFTGEGASGSGEPWGSGFPAAFLPAAGIWPRYYRLWAESAELMPSSQQATLPGFLAPKEVIVEYDPVCAGAGTLVWRSHDWLKGGGDWRLTVQRDDKQVCATLQVQNLPGLSFQQPIQWVSASWDFFGCNHLQPVQPAQVLGFLAAIAMEPE